MFYYCQVLEDIDSEVKKAKFDSVDDKDEARFLVQKSREAILAWKCHQLRSINQDRARLEVLTSLDSTRVLIVQDFAMKFMPTQYREAQSEFFGKRGISWHVSVCHRKVNNKLESQTFIHVLEAGLQDSVTVVLIMDHVLRSLKKQHSEISRAFFRQDNAGCYHSAQTVLAVNMLSQRSGIQIEQVDFSDPQGGKGCCDRKAAQIKAHVKSFVSEGHSVTTAKELKTAIESRGGIEGVRVSKVRVTNNDYKGPKSFKFNGISSLNNFTFTKGRRGFTAFRAYGIGKGTFYSWRSFVSGIYV